MVEVSSIIALVGIFLDSFIYCPFIIWWMTSIWKNRKCLIIRKRHVNVLMALCTLALLYYLIQRNIGFLIFSNLLNENTISIFQYLNCYFFPIFNYGLLYTTVYRFWLMYYKTQFANAQTNSQWESIIDPSLHEKNWWIQNKKSLGSSRYLYKYLIIIWFIIIIIEGTIWLLSYLFQTGGILVSFALSIDAIILIIPFILLFRIRQQLQIILFSDKLRVRDELQYIFIVTFIVFVIITIFSSIVGYLYFRRNNDNITQNTIATLDEMATLYNFVQLIATFGTFCATYIQTKWVLKKFVRYFHLYSSRQILNTSLKEQLLLTQKEKNENKEKIQISDVFGHNQAFYVFMNHLITEHSSECLLSLIELIQYKSSVLSDIKLTSSFMEMIQNQKEEEKDDNKDDEQLGNVLKLKESAGNMIIFPSEIPSSAIVYNSQLNILFNIPGVRMGPRQKRGTTIDANVVYQSASMRHVKSPTGNHKFAIWEQKTKKSMLKKKASTPKDKDHLSFEMKENDNKHVRIETVPEQQSIQKQANAALHRSEGELIEEYKIRGYMLYYKYIAVGAEYEINIDYGTRNKLMLLFNDINKLLSNNNVSLTDLSSMFDNCIHQMYQFCKFSISRFKTTNDFHDLIASFNLDHDDNDKKRSSSKTKRSLKSISQNRNSDKIKSMSVSSNSYSTNSYHNFDPSEHMK